MSLLSLRRHDMSIHITDYTPKRRCRMRLTPLGRRVYNRITMTIALIIAIAIVWVTCTWLAKGTPYVPENYHEMSYLDTCRFLLQPILWARLYLPLGTIVAGAWWSVGIYYGRPLCWRDVQCPQ
jgi:hypothetical protein